MFSSDTTQVSDGGYQISRSLRFNSADSAYLNRTPASATNRRTWTLSTWAKVSAFGSQVFILGAGVDGDNRTDIRFDGDSLQFVNNVANVTTANLKTTAVYRDPSAWYHIVIAVDSTQATSTNRIKIYVNGVQVTDFATATYFSQNTDTFVNNNCGQTIGRYSITASNYFNGYMTEFNLIDGSQLTPSSFGETNAQTGVWQPKAYSGSYGTNGFYLNFSDNSNTTAATLGKDYSGNGNNWTPNNFSVTAGAGNDSLVDSPTSYGTDTGVGGTVRGNYATLNPLNNVATLANGNLDISGSSAAWLGSSGTILPKSGKWYWEMTVTSLTNYVFTGIASSALAQASGVYTGSTANSYSYASNDGRKWNNGSSAVYGATYTTNDVVGIALDMDAGTLTFYKNGTSQGQAFTGISGEYGPSLSVYQAGCSINFGQRPFAYTAPSGYKALCTQNLPTPTVGATSTTLAGKYFGVTLRTGGAPSGGTYTTTVDMSNGALLWDKGRNGAQNNYLVDSNRGLTSFLQSNSTSAEATQANWYTSFGNGTYSTGSTDWGSSVSLVDWIWAAGANTTNTAGTITSTVSANTTSGFSIVTFTTDGTTKTVGHGLGVAPKMIIVKQRNGVGGAWYVFTTVIDGTYDYLSLNTTDAAANSSYTAPTATVFEYNDDNAATQVAYCFAEVAGYSKFGSYTGNGSTNGPFIYTGFRPAYVMVKPSSAAGSWWINDNKRDTYNVNDHRLNANTSDAEATSGFVQEDFLSNGFKWRNSDSAWNGSGVTYIYMAFAESPFKYSLAR